MGYSNTAGLNAYNHYGARTTGGAIGAEHEYGSRHVVKIDITGQSIADNIAGFMPPVYLPKYANIESVTLVVDEAFVVTGTTPNLEIGSYGSVATNGVVITEAELEAVGTKAIASTGAGTWAFGHASGLAAAAKIGMSLEGDTAIAATSGRGTVIIEYIYNSRA
jgi:hypothetical protein